MPLIQIKSLPFEQGREMGALLVGISRDFSEAVGIEIEQVSATWEFLEAWHYAAGGRAATNQPIDSHPILVDLLVPEVHPAETIETMLDSIAASIAERARIPITNIFINVRRAKSGKMFDGGKIVRWRTAGSAENMKISTKRMELIPATLQMLRAEIENRKALSRLLDARVPAGWPPPLNDDNAMKFALTYLKENPDATEWGMWYYLLRDRPERIVVGNGGFKGKPDREGTVEIGYSIMEEHQRQGLGSEIVRGMVDWAFGHPEVKRVIAETLPELTPSIRVLEKNGFVNIGRGSEPGVIRFELRRETYQRIQ